MITVVTVLVIVSIMVLPNLVSMKSASDRRDAISGIRRAPADARELAIQKGQTMQLVYDDATHEFQIQQVGADGTATTSTHYPITQDLEPTRFEQSGKESTSSDFKLQFSPEGRSNGGGVEFNSFSLIVDTSGGIRYIEGQLPPPEDERWEAGSLEQRG
jgi:Tfp pilus assembly protein FimT